MAGQTLINHRDSQDVFSCESKPGSCLKFSAPDLGEHVTVSDREMKKTTIGQLWSNSVSTSQYHDASSKQKRKSNSGKTRATKKETAGKGGGGGRGGTTEGGAIDQVKR